ncbi:unnamed protein product [Mesocestoides corti]|uniref:DEP domain-containing protein n=1 Tax=Mesocestoides corti TaxID=53468 RepID=A0A0R3UGM3_MESCO|nr:unnamed protein product [Mesocestoides corti]
MSLENIFAELKQVETHDEIRKMEDLIEAMQETETGINFKSQKVFLTTIPAAVSGDNLISWIENHLRIEDSQEASHIANVLLLYGYVYPLTDYKSSLVKDDPTAFYRFQAPYYWISKTPKPDPMDYAIYLVKRTLRKRPKYALEDYEQSALHRLQNMLAQKWEFICMQAADQMRLYKDKRKSDQIVLEAQVGAFVDIDMSTNFLANCIERAFWRVHHPPPSRLSCFKEGLPLQHRPSDSCLLARQQQCRQQPPPLQSHSHLRISNKKSTENILLFTANRSSYDWFLSDLHSSSSTMSATAWLSQPGSIEQSPCQPLVTLPTCDSLLTSFPLGSRLSISSSGTVTESTPYPTVNQATFTSNGPCFSSTLSFKSNAGVVHVYISAKLVRLWATSFDNLLWDPKGCQAFKAFLEKEFSSENLRFWLTVNAYQFTPISNLRAAGKRIFDEFLAPNAPSEINIDCTTRAATAEAVKVIGLVYFLWGGNPHSDPAFLPNQHTNPSWFVFLEAKQHIYKLMKSDSYVRFLRSDDYSAVLRVVLANQHSGHSRRSTVKPSLATSVPSAAEDSGLAVSSSLSQKQRCSN